MSELSVRERIVRLGTAWAIALGALVVPFPPAALFLPVFPGGLVELARRAGLCCQGKVTPYVILGWVVYVLLSVALLVIPDKRISLRLFLILCPLLALNVVGCYLAGGSGRP